METMAEPLILEESSFDQIVLQSKQPVLVDFGAPWCAPCRAIDPIIEELAREYSDRITFAKFNVDDSPKIPSTYGIHSVPTLLLFKDGKPVEQVIGLKNKKELKKVLDTALA
jgi:thioredoxin 1